MGHGRLRASWRRLPPRQGDNVLPAHAEAVPAHEPRAEKEQNAQSERTRTRGEVSTPLWVVKKMNDYMDAMWFGYEGAFDADWVVFPEGRMWAQYVLSRRMEITCGEAPYIVSRYDVSTGEEVPIAIWSWLMSITAALNISRPENVQLLLPWNDSDVRKTN